MPRKRTLAGRFLAFSLIVNSLLLIALGGALAMISGNVLQKEVTASSERMLAQTQRLVDTFFTNTRAQLIRVALQRSVVRCMNMAVPAYSKTLIHEREIQESLNGIDLYAPLQDVLLLGKNGYVFNLQNRQNLDSTYDFTATEWFQQAASVENGQHIRVLPLHDQLYYTKLKAPTARYEPTLSLSMAVTNASRQVVGAVVCTFDLRQLAQLFNEGVYEPDARLMLVDPNNVVCIRSDGRDLGRPLALSEDGLRRLYESDSGSFTSTLDGEPVLICHDVSDFCGWKLVASIPLRSIRAHSAPLGMLLAPALLLSLLVNMIVAVIYSLSVQRPVGALVQSISQMDAGSLAPIPVRTEYQELEQISTKFNDLLARVDELIRKDYRTQLELSRFELAALQAQINPHFLFNTLQLLQTEILYGNVEKSNRIIISLSQLLRYYMASGESVVPVSQEIEYLEKYLMLFTSKYEGRLTTQIDVQPEAETLTLPKLLIQPVVENSIRHAADRSSELCQIVITVQLRGDDLIISVEDDGRGIEADKLAEIRESLDRRVDWMKGRVGLANVHQRIRTVYGDGYGLSIDSSPDGTTVLLRLPGQDANLGGDRP